MHRQLDFIRQKLQQWTRQHRGQGVEFRESILVQAEVYWGHRFEAESIEALWQIDQPYFEIRLDGQWVERVELPPEFCTRHRAA